MTISLRAWSLKDFSPFVVQLREEDPEEDQDILLFWLAWEQLHILLLDHLNKKSLLALMVGWKCETECGLSLMLCPSLSEPELSDVLDMRGHVNRIIRLSKTGCLMWLVSWVLLEDLCANKKPSWFHYRTKWVLQNGIYSGSCFYFLCDQTF